MTWSSPTVSPCTVMSAYPVDGRRTAHEGGSGELGHELVLEHEAGEGDRGDETPEERRDGELVPGCELPVLSLSFCFPNSHAIHTATYL